MRFTLLLLLPLTLFGCSFGGFQPPPPHDHWRLHNSRVLFPNSDPQGRIKFLDRRHYRGQSAPFAQVAVELPVGVF